MSTSPLTRLPFAIAVSAAALPAASRARANEAGAAGPPAFAWPFGNSVPAPDPDLSTSIVTSLREGGQIAVEWMQASPTTGVIAVGTLLFGAAALRALHRFRHRDAALLDGLPDAVALFDAKGRLTAVNRKLLSLFPFEVSSEELRDSSSSDLYSQLSPDNVAIERARNRARRANQDPDATLAFELPSFGRSSLLVKERLTATGGTAIAVYPASARGEHRHSDSLTALPGRAQLVSVLARRCVRTENRLALVIVDLRGFRQLNDTYGRDAGDELLKQTAISLQHAMPESALIARTTGDEFAVLLEFAGAEDDIERRVQDVLTRLHDGLPVKERCIPVRASVGIAYMPEHGASVSELLGAADSACADAKRLGNNRLVVYSPLRRQAAQRRHQLEIGLQHAIENDELSLQYQPQIDVHTGMTCGMEALLRWNNPEFGSVSPADFVPVAEQTGIIVPIGQWVLERAIADHQRLSRYGMSPAILSVNLSRKQFDNGDIVRDISRLLDRTGFDPTKLCLEITETALFQDAASLKKILGELTALGPKLAIDDFGVGYSSLLELRDFPIAEVKIDRAFIMDIETDSASKDIVHAVVDIARSIGAEVVAEGIETQRQFDAISELGCDRAQGYFLCRPMAAMTFPDVMLG